MTATAPMVIANDGARSHAAGKTLGKLYVHQEIAVVSSLKLS
jgi:hypothetical protein